MEKAKEKKISDNILYVEQIEPSILSVEASHTVPGGGGTGQEYPKNLLIPGNTPGNKWYTDYKGSPSINLSFKEGVPIPIVKMYGWKSANDCPERDPCC